MSLSVALWSAVGIAEAQGQGETGSAEGSLSLEASGEGVEASAQATGAGLGEEGEQAPVEAESAEAAEPAAAEGQTETSAEVEMDAGTYSVRLRDLEVRVNELKEQVFRSKARLSLLAETVLQGVVAGAQARIVHENEMGNSYRLVKVVYALDGAPIFNKADEEGGLGDREQFDIYNGSIVPGEHTLTVQLEYRGHGYGIFSYLKGYRFKVSSSYTFTAPEGKAVTLRVVGFEKGGPTAPLEERPAVRYVERVETPVATPTEASGEGGE
ncbi:MAG: dihydrolipoamide acetyltransferase [Myxococcales bacterium]